MSKDKSKAVQKPKPPAPTGKAELPFAPAAPALGRWAEVGILCAILLLAAGLRLWDRRESPPGLNQDEAVNGWNAWCLLKTGKDQVGVSWPLFYLRALGSNYTPLNIYLLMPIQAIGGLDVWTTRAPAALGGILTVFLIYFVGKRLLGTAGGLLAAAMLAVNPWHLFTSRWGIEANICPLLAIAPLSLLLAARMPPGLLEGKRPCIGLAALAGVVTGLCLYGYPAMLIFGPLFLIAMVAVSWRQWRTLICGQVPRRRGDGTTGVSPVESRHGPDVDRRDACPTRGLAAALAFVLTAAAIFAPLAWMHAFHGDEIRKRTVGQWVWEFGGHEGQEYSFGTKLEAVAGRYLDHFGADFLFVSGDHSSIESPPGMGMFHWYMLPLFLLGAVWCLRSFRSSPAARVVLAWVLLYPAGDSLGWSMGDQGELCLHSLRSSPGICGLVLLAAAGAVFAGSWLRKRGRSAFWPATCALLLGAAGLNVRYLTTFFGEYNGRPFIYHKYHEDLVEACRWLRADNRFDKYDAVYCTTMRVNQPYIITLHELNYDPQRWLADEKVIDTSGMFDYIFQYGKMHFLFYPRGPMMPPDPRSGLDQLAAAGNGHKAILILRRIPAADKIVRGRDGLPMDFDEEATLRPQTRLSNWKVVHEIRRTGDNEVVLKLVEAGT